MSSPVEVIKSRLSITEVVSGYLKLDRAGSNYRARCPFHQEKTASFHVSPSRNSYHCFGCGRGGDIISFVQEIEGITFPEALKELALRAGVTLTFERPEQKRDREALLAIHQKARDHFREYLFKSTTTKAYTKERGINEESLERFGLGFAKPEWEDLYRFLRREGFSDSLIVLSGLAVPSQNKGGYYDRFRNRLMFPIEDSSGRTIAFSGRTLLSNTEEGKYVNSPETPIFKKAEVLFGYGLAKESIRKSDRVIVVEGQIDLVLSVQAGLGETVAVSGTAFSVSHLSLLRRLAQKVIFAFDSDSAGRSALYKAGILALGFGLDVSAVTLPEGKDPADIIKNAPDLWKGIVEKNDNIIRYFTKDIEKREITLEEKRKLLSKEILPLIAALPSAVAQAHFIEETASVAALSPEPLWQDLSKIKKEKSPWEEKVFSSEKDVPLRRAVLLAKEMTALSFWLSKKIDFLPEKVSMRLSEIQKEYASIFLLEEKEKEAMLFKIDLTYKDTDEAIAALVSMVKDFSLELLKEDLRESKERLREAEKIEDEETIDIYTKKCQDIAEQIAHAN